MGRSSATGQPDRLPQWSMLQSHVTRLREMPLRARFSADPTRAARFSLSACGIRLDYSKQLLDEATLATLLQVAEQQHVARLRDAMFSGESVNHTERRAALHVALRMLPGSVLKKSGRNIVDDVHAVRARMRAFVNEIYAGAHKGFSGAEFTDVVNIGLGGSDLGPQMAMLALAPSVRSKPRVHFVSNADGSHLNDIVATLRPERTLFIISSKTFSTLETMANATAARRWIVDALGEQAIARHFAAATAAPGKAERWGVLPERIFPLWDWVGGRFSLWSAIGLPLMLAIGPEAFDEVLLGAHHMDRHFCEAAPAQNMPILLALLNIWNTNFLGATSQVIAPYNQHLCRFPAYLQQLVMESNGKGVARDGSPVRYHTTPVVWGEPGISGQHAYFQMLHQGPLPVPVDFIISLQNPSSPPEQHRILLASAIAQAEALMCGRTADEVRAQMTTAGLSDDDIERVVLHRMCQGNRPSNFLLLEKLDPRTFGALVALYEHRVFVEAAIWDINPFDQWGVELGKELANRILEEFDSSGEVGAHDSSTVQLIRAVRGAGEVCAA